MLDLGIYRKSTDNYLLMDDYHNDPALNASKLTYILPPYTPRDFFENSKNSYFKGSKSTDLGTTIHSAILEPDTFDDLYIFEPKVFVKNTKDGKAEYQEFLNRCKTEGKISVPYKDKLKVEAALLAGKNHFELQDILAEGEAEVSAFAHLGHELIEGGIRSKTREDWITRDGWIYDLKTTSGNLDSRSIQKTITKYKYHTKAAHHVKVMRQAGLDIKGFGWIFATTHLPVCHIVIKKCSEKFLNYAENEQYEALELLAQCTKDGIWPGHPTDIQEIDIPSYL